MVARDPSSEISLYMFDVLGFSSALARFGLAGIYERYLSLLEILGPAEGGKPFLSAEPIDDEGNMVPVSGILDIHTAYFSDTLLIWAPYHPVAFQVLTAHVLDLFCKSLHEQLPLRGGIAFGRAIMDQERRIYLGDPIVEAYRVESSQAWCGCSFGPSLSSHPQLFPVTYYWPWREHWKQGFGREEGSSLVLDWPRRWRELYGDDEFESTVDALRQPGSEAYWDATCAFCRESATEREWWIE